LGAKPPQGGWEQQALVNNSARLMESFRGEASEGGWVGRKTNKNREGDGVNAAEKQSIIICVTNLSELAQIRLPIIREM